MQEELLKDLTYLTSSEAAGRLSATSGALAAARYLAGELAASGFQPAGDVGFFQRVQVPAARLKGPVHLQVGGRPLAHRRHFAAWAPLSGGGTFTGPLLVLREDQPVQTDRIPGSVLLVPKRPQDLDVAGTAAAAAEAGALALLVEAGEPTWFHKTIFGRREASFPVLKVRASVAAELAALEGRLVEGALPLAVQTLPCQNVLGLLPGARPDQTLLLAAHYDHVGDDPGGFRFPGARDNASGVAAVLVVARRLAASPDRLPFNLLVAFVTGEESGLWGARHLATHPPLPISAAINIDEAGGETELAALRLGHRQRGDQFAELAAVTLSEGGVEPRWIGGSDDSAAFLQAGIPTVGLGHHPVVPYRVGAHSPDDTVDALHLPAVARTVELTAALVARLAASAASVSHA